MNQNGFFYSYIFLTKLLQIYYTQLYYNTYLNLNNNKAKTYTSQARNNNAGLIVDFSLPVSVILTTKYTKYVQYCVLPRLKHELTLS